MNKLIILLAIIVVVRGKWSFNHSLYYCNSYTNQTTYISQPQNQTVCNQRSQKGTGSGECCFVTWKAQGRFYSMCAGLNGEDDIKDLRNELKDRFTRVRIECGSNYLSYSIIMLLIIATII